MDGGRRPGASREGRARSDGRIPGWPSRCVRRGRRGAHAARSGELLVRPPRMAAGYAGGDSLDDRIDDEGYLGTGDYATVDDDGFVWIEGRAGDLINRGATRSSPARSKRCCAVSPDVQEAAVVGVPDERLGEVPVAFVVGTATGETSSAALPRAPGGLQGPRGLPPDRRAAAERNRKSPAPRPDRQALACRLTNRPNRPSLLVVPGFRAIGP